LPDDLFCKNNYHYTRLFTNEVCIFEISSQGNYKDSMNSHQFKITLEKEQTLRNKMVALGIKESDIIERFIRSQGHGGQKVNKTSSCVYLKHIPTGIEVKCQQERSQSLNRFLARRILFQKIENRILGRLSEEQQTIEKIKRQKRKRSRRAKEKVLMLKHLQSDKKRERSSRDGLSDY
jgi:peptide chain release factor